MIAPPYDVVGADDEATLLARSPYNAAHIECCPGPEETRYATAAAALRAWIDAGVLRRDGAPAYYLYEQRAAIAGVARVRRGFFARLRLHRPDEGIVRPHEQTMAGPRAQRLRLLQATRTNVSPIFAMFHDDGRARGVLDAVAAGAPAFEATDGLGDRHRLWVIDDASRQATLAAAVAASNVTIADGHHRYSTALAYLDERLAAGALPDDAPERFVLTGLVADDDPGLAILPTHRLVRAESLSAAFLDGLSERYVVEPVAGWGTETSRALWQRVAAGALGPATFGLLDLAEHQAWLLTGRSREAVDAAMPQDLSPASRGLDARILTETILRPLLGIDDAALSAGERVGFTHDVDAAWRAERDGYRLAFLLNPTRADQITAVADAGELMPQKTTYFYPKLATGMVFNLLDD